MDCKTAQQLLPYHGRAAAELAPSEAQALEAHLAECPSCASQVQSEQQLDAHLAQAMRAVPIPIGLRDRLHLRLRNQRKATVRRRIDQLATAAAACLLIGLGAYLVILNRPLESPLDMNEFGSISQPRHIQQVQDWLDYQVGSPLALPLELQDRWDFDRLNYTCLQRLHQHNVPTLVFQKDDVQTVVYLLRAGQYKPDTVGTGFNPEFPQNAWKLGGDGQFEYTAVIVGEEKAFLKPPETMSRTLPSAP